MGQPPTALDLFAGELRRAREARKLSQESLSQEVKYSASLIAKIELCQRRPSLDFARRCDTVLETGGLLARIHEIVGNDVVQPWFRQWVAIERDAAILRTFQVSVVPGLLQTEAYARALLSGGNLLHPDEVEQQVHARLERQELLARSRPPQFHVVLDEYVLRRPIGGTAVMREQLDRLVKVSAAQPMIRIHVVLTATGAYPGSNGPFVLATPGDGGADVAYLDNQLTGQLVDRAENVNLIRQAWEGVQAEALPHQRSIEFIREAAERWS